MLPFEDPTSLSLLFHLNSEPWLNDEAYRRGAPHPEPPLAVGVRDEVVLPSPTPAPLRELLAGRRSCRTYAPAPIPLQALSDLLAAGYGSARPDEHGHSSARRPVPSAGGLYPLDLLVVGRRIDGLADGVYRYDPRGHVLDLLRAGDLFTPLLQGSLYAYPFVEEANGLIVMATEFLRVQRKYGPRGYRYLLLEAGHVGQNLCLAGSQAGLSTLCIGGFIDSQLNAALDLDPTRAGVVYAVAFGLAAGPSEGSPDDGAPDDGAPTDSFGG